MNYRFGAEQQAAKTMRRSAKLHRKGVTLTAGMRYVYGWGQFHKNLGLPHRGVRSLASRLTYDNSPINGVEGFGRLDTKFGVLVKGLIGGGLGGGSLNDEDWDLDFEGNVAYSNTLPDVDNNIH